MVNVEPVLDPEEPVGTLRWSSWTGKEYLHRPPEAAVAPVRPVERVRPPSAAGEEVCLSSDVAEDSSLTADWTRSVARATQEDEQRRLREQRRQRGQRVQRGRAPAGTNAGGDDPPPF